MRASFVVLRTMTTRTKVSTRIYYLHASKRTHKHIFLCILYISLSYVRTT